MPKELGTFNLPNIAGDPASPANADLWYNTGLNKFRKKQNGIISNLEDNQHNFVGTVYDKTSWTDLTDFSANTVAATANASNLIQIPSGANGNLDFTKYITLNKTTCINHWKAIVEFKLTVAKSSTTYGISFGLQSQVTPYLTDCVAYFGCTTTNSGNIYLFYRVGGGGYSQATVSGSALTFSQGDYIRFTFERVNQTFNIYAENITTNTSAVTVSYTFPSANSSIIPPNTSSLVFNRHGGAFTIQRMAFINKELFQPKVALIGDSKTVGYGASAWTNTWTWLLSKNYNDIVVAAGLADRTVDILNRITELISIKPQIAILSSFSNDKRDGISDATAQSNYASIVTQLQNNGITVWHLSSFYENSQDNSTADAWVKANYVNVLDTQFITKRWGLFTDGIHLNDNSQRVLANQIIDANIINSYCNSYS